LLHASATQSRASESLAHAEVREWRTRVFCMSIGVCMSGDIVSALRT
jgi:hypothetical protein